jgi:hypothetical protein
MGAVSRRRPPQKPRILAFADVRDSLVAACRVHAPLEALRRNGLIDDYVVTDATLRGALRRGLFDVVWLQRGADAALARLVASRLPGRFLLDVDDHLLCTPSYLKPGDLPSADALTEALVACRVLIVPSLRLAKLLERRAGVPMVAIARACPNAIAFGEAPLREPRRRTAILLTQAHTGLRSPHLSMRSSAQSRRSPRAASFRSGTSAHHPLRFSP